MRTFGLIGKSLGHSWSKFYFEQKFIRENLDDCLYLNFPLSDLQGLYDLISKDLSVSGLNVTIPYKLAVIDYLDELDPAAKAIGAVNCLEINRTVNHLSVKGYNTDMTAFRDTLKPLLDDSCRKALVLGTGGAARAVSFALQDLNIDYSFVSRGKKEGFLTYAELDESIIKGHPLIINSTPAGMFPDLGQSPSLPYKYLTNAHLLYDLIYNPAETLFLRKGAESGAKTKNGLEMLQLQAELSWRIWNSSKFKVQSSK
jgi:shikimate dehydrogenase